MTRNKPKIYLQFLVLVAALAEKAPRGRSQPEMDQLLLSRLKLTSFFNKLLRNCFTKHIYVRVFENRRQMKTEDRR